MSDNNPIQQEPSMTNNPNNSTAANTTTASYQPCSCPKTTKITRFILNITKIAVIILLIIAVTGGYFLYQNHQLIAQQNAKMQLRINELSNNLNQLQQTQLEQQKIQKNIMQLRQTSNTYINTGLLLTTYQLATAANIELKTTNNIVKANLLLTEAIQHIAKIPEFNPIKQDLANNINNLTRINETKTIGQEKIILQLNQLIQQINVLEQHLAFVEFVAIPKSTTATKIPPSSLTTPPATFNTPLNISSTNEFSSFSWNHLWQNIADSLHNIIIISHKESLPLVLTSSQLVNLKLNLHSRLLEAIWAVNYHQTKIYADSLKEVSNLLQTYFSANTSVKHDILPQLQQLQKMDINLQPLNVDQTIKMIETALIKIIS